MEFVCPEFCDFVLASLSRFDIGVATRFAAFSWSQSAAETLCKLKTFSLSVKSDERGTNRQIYQRLGQRETKISTQEFNAIDSHFRRITAITIEAEELETAEEEDDACDLIERSLLSSKLELDAPSLTMKMSDVIVASQLQFFAKHRMLFGELNLSCPKFCDSIETFLRLQVSSGILRKLTLTDGWPTQLLITQIIEPLLYQHQLELLETHQSETIVFGVNTIRNLLDQWIGDPERYSSYSHPESAAMKRRRTVRVNVDFPGAQLSSHLTLFTKGLRIVKELQRSDPTTGCWVRASSYANFRSPTHHLKLLFGNGRFAEENSDL